MPTKKILVLLGTLILAAMVLTACGGAQPGPAGPAGPAGAAGADGKSASTADLTCTQCHNDSSIITGKKATWAESLHGSGTAFADEGPRNTCAFCHSGAVFSTSIAAGVTFDKVEKGDTNPTHQDCRTCHQIHTTYTSADWALETTAPVKQVISGKTFDGGKGNLCANCHQARRYIANFVSKTDATKYAATTRFNTHLSVQGDMLLGLPGVGVEGKPGSHYSLVENTCVGCHLGEGDNHLFQPQLATCVACHADAENYDVNGAQTKVVERMAELEAALKGAGLLDAEGVPVPQDLDEAQATALWNFEVITEDASKGAHNPTYINAMLDAAFAALAP